MVTIDAKDYWESAPSSKGIINRACLYRVINAATMLSANKVGLVVNAIPEGMIREESFAGLICDLNAVAEYCETKNVNIYTEVHARKSPMMRLHEAMELKRQVSSAHIGFTLDTSLLAYQGIDFAEACQSLKDRPLNIHFRDVTDHDFFGIPGKGKVDFAHCLRALRDIGYSDPGIIELFQTEENYDVLLEDAIVQTKHYLEAIWQKMG